MGDFAVCINPGDNDWITTGEKYTVVKYYDEWITVVGDDGQAHSYYAWRFKSTEGENIMSKEAEAKALVQGRKFIVGSFDSEGKFSIASKPHGHASESLAKKEAQRLAHNDLSKTFVVMQMRYGAKAATITEI